MMPINGWNVFDADGIQSPEFDLGGKQWRIKKLLPGEAKNVLIRHVMPMFQSARETDVDGLGAMEIAMRVITCAKPENYEALSSVFVRHCIYVRNDAGQFVGLAMDYENATQGLLPIELMLLDVRAFAVNFGESVSKLIEELSRMQAEADNQMIDSEARTLSSTPESQPGTTPSTTSRRGRPKATRK